VAEAVAVRERLERLVGRLDLRPGGLAPGAVLVVRDLRVRLPVTSARDLTAGAHVSGDAGRAAVRERLGTLARQAARPTRAPVPPGAASVLFADRAELLACLTRDALAGRLGERWWWRRLAVPVLPPPRVLARAWCDEPRALPAALAALRPEERRAAVAALRPEEAHRVLAALREAHVLPAAAPESVSTDGSGAPAAQVPSGMPPWRAWLPQSFATGLGTDQEELLGTALALAAAPHLVRTESFASQVVAWRVAALALAGGNTSNPATIGPTVEHPAGSSSSRSLAEAIRRPFVSEACALPELAVGPAHPFTEAGVATAWGGVLYLLNLLDWLGPPATWAADGSLAALGGWGAVELLGRGLLARAGIDPVDDPLFDALAALDGRDSGVPLGLALRPPRGFRLPPRWLARERRSSHRWVAARRGARLWLRDAERDFLVTAIPLGGARRMDAAVERELAWYAARGVLARCIPPTGRPRRSPASSRCLRSVAPSAGRWLRCARGFIGALLHDLLGSDAADASLAECLRADGQLMVSRTHVDLVLPLDRICLPIRRAGLDRDPGWRPDLGRIVLFHFD
jgi:hypothetical protein